MILTTTGSVRTRSIGSSRNLVRGPASLQCFSFVDHLLGSINPVGGLFTPDGTKDLSTLRKRQGVDQITPNTRRLAEPNDHVLPHVSVRILPTRACLSR